MPTYTIKDNNKNEYFDTICTWGELQLFLDENPQCQKVITAPNIVSGQGINSSLTWVATNLAVTITPTVSTSDFWIIGSISAGMDNHDSNASFNVHDSALGNDYNNTAQHIFTNQSSSGNNTNQGYMSNHWSFGADGSADDYAVMQSDIFGMYSPASNSASARTFTIVCRTHTTSSNGININNVAQQGDTSHMMRQTSAFEVWEIADGIYT